MLRDQLPWIPRGGWQEETAATQAKMMVAGEVVRVGVEETHAHGTRAGGGVVLTLSWVGDGVGEGSGGNA